MGSLLVPTLVNAFLSHYEKIGLERCPEAIKPLFYRSYVDDIFVLSESHDKLINRLDFNRCHPNRSFSHEIERDGKLSFVDINVFREGGQFLTNAYCKQTFSGVSRHFEGFLPAPYKFGMVCTFTNRCFRICSDWTKFNQGLRFLKALFLKNGYCQGLLILVLKR